MFGRKKRETFLVEVDCDQKLLGKVYLFFTMLMVAFFAVKYAMEGSPSTIIFIIYMLAVLIAGGSGVWFWFFKRRPHQLWVTIGGRDNVLYVRNKLLYVLFEIAIFIVCYAVVVPVIDFFFNGFKFTWESFTEIQKDYAFIVLLFLYRSVNNYLGFYMYYKAPDKARRVD